jgi:hypothetical protein
MFQITEQAPERTGESWLLEPMVELAGLLGQQTSSTWLHSGRVARYALAFGRLAGLDRTAMMALHCAAMLHDVGKTALPAHLLNKASKLTRDEWYDITKHPMASSLMLKARRLPVRVISIAQAHHEWYDGTGYPLGLQGEAIPPGARILSLADAYYAMSSDRPYRAALRPEEIAREIEGNAGRQFDPRLMGKLLPHIGAELGQPASPRVMRVISDDEMLCLQLWFAAFPLGWEMEVWPGAWAAKCPPDLARHAQPTGGAADLTVIDGRSLRRAPAGTAEQLREPLLWIDPIDDAEPAVYRPLDLDALLGYLDPDPPPRREHGTMARPVKVLIADPYRLFRQALRLCLDERSEVEVVAEVESPSEYRRAQAKIDFEVAIVASDLLEGTHSTVPLSDNDFRLLPGEAGGNSSDALDIARPTIVLVADEDVDSMAPLPTNGLQNISQRVHIHRGAPAEVLIDAIQALSRGQGSGIRSQRS